MTHQLRQTLPLAIPLVLSNLTQMAFGLIDTAMVGAVSHVQLAAAGFVVNALAIPQVLGMGIGMGIAPLVAMAQGSGNSKQLSRLFYNGVWLSMLIGACLSAALWLGKGLVLKLGQAPEVAELAVDYFGIMGLSLFPMVVFLAMKQFADGLQLTKIGLIISLAALAVNALLCWILIYGNWGAPRLELMGAGWATLITRLLQAVAMAVAVRKLPTVANLNLNLHTGWHFCRSTIRQLLNLGVPASVQHVLEVGAFSVSGIMIGWLGATTQAAHHIALSCASFTFMASLGLSLAGSIRVSHAFGQKNIPLVRSIGTSTLLTGLVYGIVCALGFVVLQHQLPLLFTRNEAVVFAAAKLLLLAALFQISDATQAIGVGLLRGITDVKRPTLYVALAYWAIGLPVGYFLTFVLKMGASGIWLGLVLGLTASSILLNYRFLRMTK